MRAVALGDFNLIPGSGEYAALGHGVDEGPTCDGFRGNVRLDYAFVTPDLTGALRAISVDTEAQGSDHQPIRIEIEL